MNELRELINKTWERRGEITPVYEKRTLRAKDILALLPKTNCGECGLPNCFAFAMAMVRGQKKLTDCPPLQQHRENMEALKELLKTVGLE